MSFDRLPPTKSKSAERRLDELSKKYSLEKIAIIGANGKVELKSEEFRNFKGGYEILTSEYSYINDHSPRWHSYIQLFVQSKKSLFKFYFGGEI